MNGVHDMGGSHGFGAVLPEGEGNPFHADWEELVHALVLASPTRGNIDAGRFARESIPGPVYLGMTYYQRWFAALEAMLLASGRVSAEEMASGRADPDIPRGTPALAAADVPAALARRGSYVREAPAPARFAIGDRVRARVISPAGHTRLPRYARGRCGVITAHHGAHVFPDSHAHGLGDDPRHLYTVRFAARELWGDEAAPGDGVRLDLWEPYLEPA